MKNIYNTENINEEVQQKIFVEIVSTALYINENNVAVFDVDKLQNKNLIKYTTLIRKAEKLTNMINENQAILDLDIETELWNIL